MRGFIRLVYYDRLSCHIVSNGGIDFALRHDHYMCLDFTLCNNHTTLRRIDTAGFPYFDIHSLVVRGINRCFKWLGGCGQSEGKRLSHVKLFKNGRLHVCFEGDISGTGFRDIVLRPERGLRRIGGLARRGWHQCSGVR